MEVVRDERVILNSAELIEILEEHGISLSNSCVMQIKRYPDLHRYIGTRALGIDWLVFIVAPTKV